MTQTSIVVSSPDVTPTTPAGSILRVTDDSILVKVWSTPIACDDTSSFTATPGVGGDITVQFSPDGVNYTNAAEVPYTSTFSGGVPPTALWVRATATVSTGALVVDTPVPWTELTASQVTAVGRITAGLNGTSAPAVRKWIELLSCQNSALWDDRAGAGMTVSVDYAVLFDGKPTLRLDIPALSSGTYRVGTTAAVCLPPYNWDGKQLTAAFMSSNMTAVSGCSVFLGDVGFTNYNSFQGQTSSANIPEAAMVAGDWFVARGTQLVPTGSPTLTGAKRIRVNFTVTSAATATTVWLGFVGIAAPKKTTVVVSIDDGYASGYSFVAPVSRYYKIPVSFGIDRAYTGAANYMTAAQIQELHADTSDLFEFVTHGYNNGNVSVRGDTQYVQDNVDTRAYLRTLGINGDGPNHHPWVQSLQTNAAIAGLKAAGFLSARIGAVTPKSAHDSHFYTGQDKRAYQLINCTTVTTGVSLATAQSAVSSAVTEGYGVTHLNAHDFAAADAASPPTWSYDKWIDLMGWLDAQRTAGTIEIKTWGRWYADLIGVAYSK